MSRRTTPQEPTPVQPVESPILSSPYVEPTEHLVYDQETGEAHVMPGRRPASYFDPAYREKDQQLRLSGMAEETRNELEMVNRLRQDVKRWRESGYRGGTSWTVKLLEHWTRSDHDRPLFFCQREAVETIIWILELMLPGRSPWRTHAVTPEDLATLSDPSTGSGQVLLRLGCKMATGSGKTVVMAMTSSGRCSTTCASRRIGASPARCWSAART